MSRKHKRDHKCKPEICIESPEVRAETTAGIFDNIIRLIIVLLALQFLCECILDEVEC